jgi:hypothetical protein
VLTERNDANALVRATTTGATITNGTFHVVSAIKGSATMEVWYDGTNVGTNTPPAAPSTVTTASLGGSSFAVSAGDIAEIVLFSDVLSDTNRRAVEAYLGTKYAITVT